MIKTTINNHEFVFYDNIEDLPIKQFHKYGKYSLVDGGIGDSIQDIDKHITRVLQFMEFDVSKAKKELMNLRQSLYMVANEVDFHRKATLCLVKSVDGNDWTDFSDSGIDSLYAMAQDATIREIEDVAEKIRNEIDTALQTYFPKVFNDSSSKNYLDMMRKRALLQVEQMVKGEDHAEEIRKITEDLFSTSSPHSFSGSESEEIKFDKQFEDMCLVMAKEFGGDIKKYTTMEFYSAFERLLKQSEENKKLMNRRKRNGK